MHDEIVLLGEAKLDTIKVLICKVLVDMYVHDEFVSVNNELREYNDMKDKLKNPRNMWNTLYKNNGNVLCHLEEKYCKRKLKC